MNGQQADREAVCDRRCRRGIRLKGGKLNQFPDRFHDGGG